MTDIPDDIMLAAEQAWRSCWTPLTDDTLFGSEAIALAILAERERCAKVAEACARGQWVAEPSPHNAALCEMIGDDIAEAIRKGEQ